MVWSNRKYDSKGFTDPNMNPAQGRQDNKKLQKAHTPQIARHAGDRGGKVLITKKKIVVAENWIIIQQEDYNRSNTNAVNPI